MQCNSSFAEHEDEKTPMLSPSPEARREDHIAALPSKEAIFTDEEAGYLDRRPLRSSWSPTKILIGLVTVTTLLTLLAFQSRRGFHPPRFHKFTGVQPEQHKTKALVIASYLRQNMSWMDELEDDWQVYRYIMDDPTAKYHPPLNAGREAMAYLTFIIDHYDDLPDYVAFIHGHERSWHQPEPMQWRLPTLNLEVLERDRYVSFHCSHQTSCSAKPRLDFSANFNDMDSTGRLIPWFWRYAGIAPELPEKMSWPDGAQFAVSKAAIHSRSRAWWIRYRAPILNSDDRMDHFNSKGYFWGLMHERLWHVAFGMPPIHCPSESYCTKVQWSNGVLCDKYPGLPIVPPWISHKVVPDLVTCFKNDNGTDEWPLKHWSLCDDPEYAQSEEANCPFEGWPLP